MIDNPPAFPFKYTITGGSNRLDGTKVPENTTENYINSGMSLRDYFAAAALQGLVSQVDNKDWEIIRDPKQQDRVADAHKVVAKTAYDLADAMLAQRSKQS